jgi:hypothetical protein
MYSSAGGQSRAGNMYDKSDIDPLSIRSQETLDSNIAKDASMESQTDVWMFRYTILALSVILTISICLDILDGSLFSWHPVFMSLGFLTLMTQAVLMGWEFRGLDGAARSTAITRHALVQFAACICIGIGFWTIYQNKVCIGS